MGTIRAYIRASFMNSKRRLCGLDILSSLLDYGGIDTDSLLIKGVHGGISKYIPVLSSSLFNCLCFVCFCVLSYINHKCYIATLHLFISGSGKRKVPIRSSFQTLAGTWVESSTFHSLA